MDFMQAIRYQFEDEDWFSKLGLGAVITLVPILNFAIYGYMAQVTRNVATGNPRPLPRWDTVSEMFIKGLYFVVGQFVYSIIPAILISVSMPLFILPIAMVEDEQALAGLTAGIAIGGCLLILGVVLGFILGFIFMAGAIRFSVGQQSLGELLDVRANVEYLRANMGSFMTAFAYVFGLALVIGTVISCVTFFLSVIPICGTLIGVVITMVISFFILMFSAHIYGQLARITGLVPPTPQAG